MVGTFWDDVDCVVVKAHDAISVEDLKPPTTKLSVELVSSHVHKVMQVCSLLLWYVFMKVFLLISSKIYMLKVLGESLCLSGKYLDYEKNYVVA